MKLIFILVLLVQAAIITCDIAQDGGLYMIFPKGSGKALGIDGASSDVGAQLVAGTIACDDSQKFTLKQYDANSFTVVVKSTGKVLTANGPSPADFTYLYQRDEDHATYYQEISFAPGPDGYYFISMEGSSEDYTLNIDGHTLTFEPVSGEDNQLFWLQATTPSTSQCLDCAAPQAYIAATYSCGTCTAPQVYNPSTYACENCVAPQTYIAATKTCGTCTAPQVYNSNNYACEDCQAPKAYNSQTQSCEDCVSPAAYLAATKTCGTCTAPQVYNSNAYACENCQAGDYYNYDGTCISDGECPSYLRDNQEGIPICKFPCTKTQIYQPITNRCQCSCSSPFTKETVNGYQVCMLL